MTQDEIIEMWKNSGDLEIIGMPYSKIESFAKLVRDDYSNKHAQLWLKRIDEAVKAERDACAVIAEEYFCGCGRGKCPEEDARAHEIAEAIRARAQAERGEA